MRLLTTLVLLSDGDRHPGMKLKSCPGRGSPLTIHTRPQSQIELVQLLFAGLGRCPGQQAGRLLGFGEGDDIADG